MKTIAITGAAGGIGRALVLHYASAGWQVLGFDLDEPALIETSRLASKLPGKFRPSILNLESIEDRERLIEVLRRRGGVEVFVHNAAVNLAGPFEQLDFASQERLIELNFTAPVALTGTLLAESLIGKGGALVFLSSLSWFVGYPGAAVYGATKDALAHYARSLRVAVREKKIHVMTVYPGPVRTPMATRWSPDGKAGEKRRMPPEELANRIAGAMDRRQDELIPGRLNQVLAFLGSRFPGTSGFLMKRMIYDRLENAARTGASASTSPRDCGNSSRD